MIIQNLAFMVLCNGSRGNFDISEVMEIKRSVSVDVQHVCFQLFFFYHRKAKTVRPPDMLCPRRGVPTIIPRRVRTKTAAKAL